MRKINLFLLFFALLFLITTHTIIPQETPPPEETPEPTEEVVEETETVEEEPPVEEEEPVVEEEPVEEPPAEEEEAPVEEEKPAEEEEAPVEEEEPVVEEEPVEEPPAEEEEAPVEEEEPVTEEEEPPAEEPVVEEEEAPVEEEKPAEEEEAPVEEEEPVTEEEEPPAEEPVVEEEEAPVEEEKPAEEEEAPVEEEEPVTEEEEPPAEEPVVEEEEEEPEEEEEFEGEEEFEEADFEEEPFAKEIGEFEEGFGASGEEMTVIGGVSQLAQMANPAAFIGSVLSLLRVSLGSAVTSPLHMFMGKIEQAKGAMIASFQKNLMFKLPLVGMFKFVNLRDKAERKAYEKIEGVRPDMPDLMGTLYDLKGKAIKKLKIGPIGLEKLKIAVTGGIPRIEAAVSFFKKQGEIKQAQTTQGEVIFILTLKQPIHIPVGLKRRVKIEQFKLKIGAGGQLLYTETNIFGTKDEEPSRISLNVGAPPFAFKIQSKNIPMGVISPLLKASPLKNVLFKSLTLQATPLPPAVSLSGIADVSKIKLGISDMKSEAKVKASLGLTGFHFIFQLANVKLPLNLGIIHKAQLQIGKPTATATGEMEMGMDEEIGMDEEMEEEEEDVEEETEEEETEEEDVDEETNVEEEDVEEETE